MRTLTNKLTETEKALIDIAYQLESLNSNLGYLTDALERTDDFNNWSYAESLASIANSLVQSNALEKTKMKKDSKSKKNPFNWQNGKGYTFRLVDIKPFKNQDQDDAKLTFEVRVNGVVDTYFSTYLNPSAEPLNGTLNNYFDYGDRWDDLMATINEYTWGDISNKYIIGKS